MNFDEVLAEVPGELAGLPVGRNQCGDHELSALLELARHPSGTLEVLDPIVFGESRAGILRAKPITVEQLHGAASLEQLALQSLGHGGLARTGETRQPEDFRNHLFHQNHAIKGRIALTVEIRPRLGDIRGTRSSCLNTSMTHP